MVLIAKIFRFCYGSVLAMSNKHYYWVVQKQQAHLFAIYIYIYMVICIYIYYARYLLSFVDIVKFKTKRKFVVQTVFYVFTWKQTLLLY